MTTTNGDKWEMRVGVGTMFYPTLKIWKITLVEKINFMEQVENGK